MLMRKFLFSSRCGLEFDFDFNSQANAVCAVYMSGGGDETSGHYVETKIITP